MEDNAKPPESRTCKKCGFTMSLIVTPSEMRLICTKCGYKKEM